MVFQSTIVDVRRIIVAISSPVRILRCPLDIPIGVLGKKWTLPILRDIEFRSITRFTDLHQSVNGITRRMLSARLDQLSQEGLIEQSSETKSWHLTPKGRDMMAVLIQIFTFRLKWDANRIFSDGQPRAPGDLFSSNLLWRRPSTAYPTCHF